MTEQTGSAGTSAGGTTAVQREPGGADGAATAGFDWQAALGPAYGQHERLLQAKGWKGPGEALASYAGLEAMLGADKVALPAKDAPPEAWEGVWRRLGRPDAPEGYELQRPADLGLYSDDFAGKFRAAAHQAGLSKKQAAVLHDWWVGEVGQGLQGQEGADARGQAELERTLDVAWGSAKTEKLALAQRAARHFGLEAERLDHLERLVGDFKLLDSLAAMGGLLREDNLTGRETAVMTQEAARGELKRLEADGEFRRAYIDRAHPGHGEAVRRMSELAERAFPLNVARAGR